MERSRSGAERTGAATRDGSGWNGQEQTGVRTELERGGVERSEGRSETGAER